MKVLHNSGPLHSTKDLLTNRLEQEDTYWSKEEIQELVDGIVNGDVSKIQLGAFLASCYLKPLTDEETFALTNAMLCSGTRFNWPEDWVVVDKHSTGGVGDKVSLVLAPALAALDLKVPMISGRGLGLTGGTLDKLESIPGYTVAIDSDRIKEIMGEVGCCIVGQTSSIVPADAIMYPARDETGTVSSTPLIVGSILSKKLAEGLKALVLEVTYGGMAFLATEEKKENFVRLAKHVCKAMGVAVSFEFVDMTNPLGATVGNALEVNEALDCLQGGGPDSTNDLTATLGGRLLHSIDRCESVEEGTKMVMEVIKNGKALEKFRQMMIAQGVTEKVASDLCDPGVENFQNGLLKKSLYKTPLLSCHTGKIIKIIGAKIARGVLELGGARSKSSDVINHAVGVELLAQVGDQITEGSKWVSIHHDLDLSPGVLEMIESALVIE